MEVIRIQNSKKTFVNKKILSYENIQPIKTKTNRRWRNIFLHITDSKYSKPK